jgi:ribokinase
MAGSSNTDLIARVPRLPRLGECLTGSTFQVAHGGKGANQAVTAARLGAAVSVVTRLGRDVFGEDYVRHFRDEGIDTTFVSVDDGLPSGATLILVDEPTGLNTMAFTPGANGALSPADVHAAREAIVTADVLLCQLEIPVESTLEAFRIAGEATGAGCLRVLNAAPVPGRPLPDELLRLADVLVANEEEAAFLSSSPVETVEEAVSASVGLAARWGVTTILTLGARGVLVATPDGRNRHQPVLQVQAVDTTGAGDAFVGSLAYLMAGGCGLDLAVERAADVATMTVLAAGAQPSFPTRARVREILGW